MLRVHAPPDCSGCSETQLALSCCLRRRASSRLPGKNHCKQGYHGEYAPLGEAGHPWWTWGWLKLVCPDVTQGGAITVAIRWPWLSPLVGSHLLAVNCGAATVCADAVNRRAAFQQGVGKGRAAVILQRAEQGVLAVDVTGYVATNGAATGIFDEVTAIGGVYAVPIRTSSPSIVAGDNAVIDVRHVIRVVHAPAVLLRGVVTDRAVGERYRAPVVDASAAGSVTTGDSEAGDGHNRYRGNGEDAAGIVAADGQDACAGAGDGKILVEHELTAGQGDGAGDCVSEGYLVPAAGIGNRLAQRACPAVIGIGHLDGSGMNYHRWRQDERQDCQKPASED